MMTACAFGDQVDNKVESSLPREPALAMPSDEEWVTLDLKVGRNTPAKARNATENFPVVCLRTTTQYSSILLKYAALFLFYIHFALLVYTLQPMPRTAAQAFPHGVPFFFVFVVIICRSSYFFTPHSCVRNRHIIASQLEVSGL